MKIKRGDIVRLDLMHDECLVVEVGIDVETKEKRYVLIGNDGRTCYIAKECDLIKISDLEEELNNVLEENTTGEA